MIIINRIRGKQVVQKAVVQKGSKLNKRLRKISNCSEIPNSSDKNRDLPDLKIDVIIKKLVNQLIL